MAGRLIVALTITGLLSGDRIEIPTNHLGHYINGEQIRCYQTGTGPDILLIHGLPGLIEDWQPIFAAAAGKYRMKEDGRPFVLAEQHRWLRDLAMNDLRDPTRYWDKLEKLRTIQGIPPAVRASLTRALPERRLSCRVVHRRAGLGSLGRRRFTALVEWRGGKIAREAKELVTSAWCWEKAERKGQRLFHAVIDQSVRVPDPMTWVAGHWLVCRLAPDCSRVELGTLPRSKDELKLVQAMGWETANVHLGTKGAARSVLADLKRRPAQWLQRAVEAMTKSTVEDWKVWAASGRSGNSWPRT